MTKTICVWCGRETYVAKNGTVAIHVPPTTGANYKCPGSGNARRNADPSWLRSQFS